MLLVLNEKEGASNVQVIVYYLEARLIYLKTNNQGETIQCLLGDAIGKNKKESCY